MITKVLFLAFLAFVGYTAAQCCTPRAWQGDVMGFDKLKDAAFFEFVAYNYPHAYRADVYVDISSRRIKETFLADFDNGYLYEVDEKNNCKKTALTDKVMPEACVPGDYIHKYDFHIGLDFPITAYEYADSKNATFFSVTAKSCIPIKGQFFDRKGREGAVDYLNIQAGITNPNIFNPPPGC